MKKQHSQKENKEMLESGMRYAHALTHNREDAEDLVQQSWLNLCRRYGYVENRAILFTSIRNLFYDHCRRAKIVRFEAMENHAEPHDPKPVSKNSMAKGDLETLMAHLAPKERETLYLNCVEGYSAREISELSGTPRGTILSLLSRAKQKLVEVVQKEKGGISDG